MFLEKIKQALQSLSEKHTKEELGDRSTYIGASDIGGCPRKVLYSKIYPQQNSLNTLIQQKRGHIAEDILQEAFDEAGFKYQSQVEVIHNDKNLPIKAHLDFVFTSEKNKTKAVLEVKAPKDVLPDTPYESWIMQLHLQMGLLKQQYPDYEIKGAIFLLGLSCGDIKVFNNYTYNQILFEGLISRSSELWANLEALKDEPDTEISTEVTPLCSYCDYIVSCPAMEAEEIPELEGSALELINLKEQKKSLDTTIKNISSELSVIFDERDNDKIIAGNFLLQKINRNRSSIDLSALGGFLEQHEKSIGEFQKNTPYSFVDIKNINKN